jgi:hypothetical protein
LFVRRPFTRPIVVATANVRFRFVQSFNASVRPRLRNQRIHNTSTNPRRKNDLGRTLWMPRCRTPVRRIAPVDGIAAFSKTPISDAEFRGTRQFMH